MSLSAIRPWSERKLEILRKYSHAYTTIMKNTSLTFIYIDAFAGEGKYVSEETGKVVPGSPLTVLDLDFPFREYHFVDVDPGKAQSLKELTIDYPNSQTKFSPEPDMKIIAVCCVCWILMACIWIGT
jgi:three-Cys-motif partner protein